MPNVQPRAANTLARLPRRSPVETVKMTPVPGIRTTINDVMRNSVVIMGSPFIERGWLTEGFYEARHAALVTDDRYGAMFFMARATYSSFSPTGAT